MSRSRKKHPICGVTTAKSEKEDKTLARRRLRKKIKTFDVDGAVVPHKNMAGNPWTMAKDGKQIWKDPKAYRK